MALTIDYLPLSELKKWPGNPKEHDSLLLEKSVSRFGFIQPVLVDDRSEMIVAGHGRIEVLSQMKARGENPPDRVEIAEDGEWKIPVIRGVEFNSDSEREAYAISDNRTSELGGWDLEKLTAALSGLAEQGEELLEGTGYDQDFVDALIFGGADEDEDENGEWSEEDEAGESEDDDLGPDDESEDDLGRIILVYSTPAEKAFWLDRLGTGEDKLVFTVADLQ